MKTILVVSYHYPPEEGSCSEKNTRIVQLLLDNNYKVIVLTKPGNYFQNHENLKILRTEKTGIFHKTKNSTNCGRENTSNGKTLKGRIKNWMSGFMIPDGTIDWLWEVKEFYRANPTVFHGIDLILSISSPYSAHLATSFLSKKMHVPYVMSYGDPWIYEPKRKRGWLRYRVEFLLEKYLVRNSLGISLITEWNKKKYCALYSIPKELIYTYQIGFDKNDVKNISLTSHLSFNVIYGGSLDPIHRDPYPFLKAIANVENIHVSIYNNDFPKLTEIAQNLHLNSKLSVYPLIKSKDFVIKMYEHDALILFGNRTPFQVPGKVFTYIATGKTIIYIKNNSCENDGTEEVLKEYGNVIIINNDAKEIEKKLSEFILNRGEQNGIETNRDSFEFHHTMYPIIKMINSALASVKG